MRHGRAAGDRWPRSAAARSRVAGLACAICAVAPLLGACERKAPGPAECLSFADAWLRGQKPERMPRLVAEGAFDELVVRCLTEPYDRELVSCVTGGFPRERCRVDYARRTEARREAR